LGFGGGGWGVRPKPQKPQSPIPNPQSPIPNEKVFKFIRIKKIKTKQFFNFLYY